jgi:group I intron endonuclease
MIGVYKIVSPVGKVYVGQSVNVEKRFREYRGLQNCYRQFKLYNSLVKYGVENHSFELLCECDLAELNYLERHYQDLYDVVNSGLNLRYTKVGDKSGYMSPDSIQKMKQSNKRHNLGRMWIHKGDDSKYINRENFDSYEQCGYIAGQSDIHKAKNRDKQIGRKHTDEVKLKISKANSSREVSGTTKAKLSAQRIGKYTGSNNPHAKMVKKIDIDTNRLLATYSTGKEASEANNISRARISSCCTGKTLSAGGFKWSF